MKKQDYDQKTIQKVKCLVENHEFGGDSETDVLKDADSIAFFDYNIPFYLKRNGKDRAIGKIKFMYKRLSPKSRKIVDKMKFKNKEITELVKKAVSEI